MSSDYRYNNFVAVCIQECLSCPLKFGVQPLKRKPLTAEVTEVILRGKKAFHIKNQGGVFPKYMKERYPSDHFNLFAKKGRARMLGEVFIDEDLVDLYEETRKEEIIKNEPEQKVLEESKKIKKERPPEVSKTVEPKMPGPKNALKSKFEDFFPAPNRQTRQNSTEKQVPFPKDSKPLEAFKYIFDEIDKIKVTCEELKQENKELKVAQIATEKNVEKIGSIATETAMKLLAYEQSYGSQQGTSDTLPISMRISKPKPTMVKNESESTSIQGRTLGGGHFPWP